MACPLPHGLPPRKSRGTRGQDGNRVPFTFPPTSRLWAFPSLEPFLPDTHATSGQIPAPNTPVQIYQPKLTQGKMGPGSWARFPHVTQLEVRSIDSLRICQAPALCPDVGKIREEPDTGPAQEGLGSNKRQTGRWEELQRQRKTAQGSSRQAKARPGLSLLNTHSAEPDGTQRAGHSADPGQPALSVNQTGGDAHLRGACKFPGGWDGATPPQVLSTSPSPLQGCRPALTSSTPEQDGI